MIKIEFPMFSTRLYKNPSPNRWESLTGALKVISEGPGLLHQNISEGYGKKVEACVAEQLTPQTLDLEVWASSLAHCVVSLDKELYSTLSLFNRPGV